MSLFVQVKRQQQAIDSICNLSLRLHTRPEAKILKGNLNYLLADTAKTYLQPHYNNGVFGNVYLSAGQQ